MTKTAKRTLILTLALLLMLSLAALFTGFLKASASVVVDNGYLGFKEEPKLVTVDKNSSLIDDLRIVEKTEDIGGKYLFFDTSEFKKAGVTEEVLKVGNALLHFNITNDKVTFDAVFTTTTQTSYKWEGGAEDEFCVLIPENVGGTGASVFAITLDETEKETSTYVYVSDTFDGVIPEPEDPAADEGTIFDKASEWLQTNTGIAISSGGIVVIGVIILLLIFTKRK